MIITQPLFVFILYYIISPLTFVQEPYLID